MSAQPPCHACSRQWKSAILTTSTYLSNYAVRKTYWSRRHPLNPRQSSVRRPEREGTWRHRIRDAQLYGCVRPYGLSCHDKPVRQTSRPSEFHSCHGSASFHADARILQCPRTHSHERLMVAQKHVSQMGRHNLSSYQKSENCKFTMIR